MNDAPRAHARPRPRDRVRAAYRPGRLWAGIPAWAAALALAGCSTLAPPYQPPVLPVAETYPTSSSGAAAPALGWRDYFADPQLHLLIEQALAHNRDLRIATLRVQEARTVHGIRRTERLPSLSVGADAARGRTPADLSPVGRATTSGQYQVMLGVQAWELDFWGRVQSLEEAALQDYLATDQARRAVHLMLVTDVAQAYQGLRELDERLALATRTVDSHRAAERIFARRLAVGATSRLELIQVQTLLHQALSLQVQLQQQRDRALHTLSLLVGGTVDLGPATRALDETWLTQGLWAELPSELLAARPDITAAEHRLRAATANIGAARAAFFPRIALTGTAGTASAQLEGLFEAGSGAWRFAPSISLPIFDGGRRRANLELAELRRDIAVADYEKAIQAAFREVSDALAARGRLAAQIDIQRQALAVQGERARLAQLRFDSGAAAFLEVLDARRDLLAAEQQLVQTRGALVAAGVSLYAALGGGTRHIPPAEASPERPNRTSPR